MTNKERDNVVRLDMVRIKQGMSKLCNCTRPRYEVDSVNRLVYCKCGAIIDPFDAVEDIARDWERAARELGRAREEAKRLDEYKPWLRAIKELESQYRCKMVPFCPSCNNPVDIVKLANNGTCSRACAEKSGRGK